MRFRLRARKPSLPEAWQWTRSTGRPHPSRASPADAGQTDRVAVMPQAVMPPAG
jgi:hypothetical protein